MYKLKTKPNNKDIMQFLQSIKDETKKDDSSRLLDIMSDITKQKPKMWGNSIIGFGLYDYEYKSGHKGSWFVVGFSPRVQNISLYFSLCSFDKYKDILEKLGKHKTSVSCLYIKKLADINIDVLKQLITLSFDNKK